MRIIWKKHLSSVVVFITSKFTSYMFNQISFQLLMHLIITNSSSNTHHIGDICRNICRIRENHMWTFVVFSFLELWNIKLNISISFVFYYHIMEYDICSHNLSDFDFIPKSAEFLTMAKQTCKTPKASLTSFRTASWCWANKTAFGLCGIGIDWINVTHFG